MTPIIGAEIAATLRQKVAHQAALMGKAGMVPGLAVVLVGEDPASTIYVRRKSEQCQEVGVLSFVHRLPETCPEAELLSHIRGLNADVSVHGIIVQLPLPKHINVSRILEAIDPRKDVDGFHPVNLGRLANGTASLVPCTPLGCMLMLETVVDDFRGKGAVVIGRSNIVGKPMSLLLLERGCTVTMAHSQTRNLPDVVRTAEIVIAAVGQPALVKGNWIKPGAVVIDVGINRVSTEGGKSRIVGDVAYLEMNHAKAVSPVPGGVGPMTIACLLSNTVKAAREANRGS